MRKKQLHRVRGSKSMALVRNTFFFLTVITWYVWLIVDPPGLSLPVQIIVGLVLILIAAVGEERLWIQIGVFLTVFLGPAVVVLLTGLLNYIQLDSASCPHNHCSQSSVLRTGRPLVIHMSDTHFISSKENST